ncbi:hypothetical protein [Limosilactobacillus reuteri]|uniref:Uncharacterized protein n=1 Tax=Limosilactobacillus reuteri TaxID=1598 RepID=A0A855XAR9_LIMRT|nr:hypothetical protein [Limosilactobacillus reuteri]MCC4467314.1 hypothetical protein [Limosilactobacillus reuteri]MCC4473995.1 hypothetical protein [Limosilactobacillus reuteri]PWT33880.1 hypothetical protein DKZ21_01150 [Limosilactobacillus reuteri]PWT39904.1 hypothetical protein DKZ22_09985 [Limosilactobacillus reuteri]PWT45345.1 hypothetical protein DKZ25_01150 [Limosilactobacillus reuteri]
MKITIIGPDDSKLLESFLNGKPVSFAEHKGYKIFVDDAYEKEKKLKRMNESAFGWTTSICVSVVTAILTTIVWYIALR